MTGHTADDWEPDPRRWRALAVCLAAGFMTLLDLSIVNVALPSIRTGLHASSSDLQWVVSGYALAFGLVLVPSGRLGDARGRRTMFAVGVGLFTVASVGCGVAQSATWLLIARFIQGVAGGVLNPQVSALIQLLFRGAERAKAFGLLASTIGISTAVGPVAGGILINVFGVEHGWRWIFFVNVPIGIATVLLALRLVPAPTEDQRRNRESLDPVGVVLLGLGVISLLLPLVEEQQWHGHAKWLLVLLGVLILGAFLLWEAAYRRRGHSPLIELSLFEMRSYTTGAFLGLVFFSGFAGIFFVLALYFQTGRGYSALLAGLAITPYALGSAVSAAIGGRLVTRFGRQLVVIGLVIVVVGLVATDVVLSHDDSHAVGYASAVPLLVAGFGSGFVIAPNLTLSLHDVPVRRAGTAGGVLQTGQRIGSAIGIAATGSVFFTTLSSSHGDYERAVSHGLRTAAALTAAALVIGLVDLALSRRRVKAPDRAA